MVEATKGFKGANRTEPLGNPNVLSHRGNCRSGRNCRMARSIGKRSDDAQLGSCPSDQYSCTKLKARPPNFELAVPSVSLREASKH